MGTLFPRTLTDRYWQRLEFLLRDLEERFEDGLYLSLTFYERPDLEELFKGLDFEDSISKLKTLSPESLYWALTKIMESDPVDREYLTRERALDPTPYQVPRRIALTEDPETIALVEELLSLQIKLREGERIDYRRTERAILQVFAKTTYVDMTAKPELLKLISRPQYFELIHPEILAKWVRSTNVLDEFLTVLHSALTDPSAFTVIQVDDPKRRTIGQIRRELELQEVPSRQVKTRTLAGIRNIRSQIRGLR